MVTAIIPSTPQPWATRFADLPVVRPAILLPAMDGDIALLHELRDRVFACGPTGLDASRNIEWETRAALGWWKR